MEIDTFEHDGLRIAYETHGEGPRVLVHVHAALLDAGSNRRLAALLAAEGHRVVLPEMPGHGRSDKPTHAYDHRLQLAASQVLALLDHLELDEAVVGGVSLGANVALQVASLQPRRVRGMVLEVPLLERGAVIAYGGFLPVLAGLRVFGWALRPATRLLRRLPRPSLPEAASLLDALSADPRETAAVVHGWIVGSTAPPEPRRRQLDMPSLVIGHRLGLLHPMSDAAALVRELPQAELVRTLSIVEARLRPARLVDEFDAFLTRAWSPRLATTRGA